MKDIESRALITFIGTAPSTGSGMWTTPGSKSEQGKWNFHTCKYCAQCYWVHMGSLPYLCIAVHTEEDRSLNTEVCRKPTHRSILDVGLSSPTGSQDVFFFFFRTLNHWDRAHKDRREGGGTIVCHSWVSGINQIWLLVSCCHSSVLWHKVCCSSFTSSTTLHQQIPMVCTCHKDENKVLLLS